MPGSLKEQSIPLEFAKFESINDLFDHLIWRWNFKNQSGKYAICTRMRDPSPKMKKNIFVRFSGLISSKSKSEIKSWKITSFGEGLRDCWQTICATYCPILFPFFPRALGFPQIMSNVCCDSTKHEPILSFCSILLTNWWNIRKKNQFWKCH